jgi:excinuclease UvrABC nuclease subunit
MAYIRPEGEGRRYDRAAVAAPRLGALVYICRDVRGVALYVGMTTNPVERWRQHARLKPWWSEVLEIETEPHPSPAHALDRERELIALLRPTYNIRSAARVRGGA